MEFAGRQVLFPPSPSSLALTAVYDTACGWRLRVAALYRLPDGGWACGTEDYGPMSWSELGDVVLASLECPPAP